MVSYTLSHLSEEQCFVAPEGNWWASVSFPDLWNMMKQWWKNSSLWYFLCNLRNTTLTWVVLNDQSLYEGQFSFFRYVFKCIHPGDFALSWGQVRAKQAFFLHMNCNNVFDLFLHNEREKWQLKVLCIVIGKW